MIGTVGKRIITNLQYYTETYNPFILFLTIFKENGLSLS